MEIKIMKSVVKYEIEDGATTEKDSISGEIWKDTGIRDVVMITGIDFAEGDPRREVIASFVRKFNSYAIMWTITNEKGATDMLLLEVLAKSLDFKSCSFMYDDAPEKKYFVYTKGAGELVYNRLEYAFMIYLLKDLDADEEMVGRFVDCIVSTPSLSRKIKEAMDASTAIGGKKAEAF